MPLAVVVEVALPGEQGVGEELQGSQLPRPADAELTEWEYGQGRHRVVWHLVESHRFFLGGLAAALMASLRWRAKLSCGVT